MQGNGGYTELSMLCVVACGWCVTWIGTLHLDQVPAPHSKPCMLLVLVMHVWKFHPPPPPNPESLTDKYFEKFIRRNMKCLRLAAVKQKYAAKGQPQ